jgi:enoyl-CoA hydratase/carnithine racemase
MTMADYEQILSDLKDGVLTLTLNRPDRLNAWTDVMHNELKHAIVTASSDDAVRVIVVTGAGRGFCAGADMDVLQGIQGGARDRLTEIEERRPTCGISIPAGSATCMPARSRSSRRSMAPAPGSA